MLEEGQIVWIDFPFSDIPGEKTRPAFVWEDSGDNVIVSMITSRVRGGRWEVPINPETANNLTRPSVIRVDNTVSISKGKLTSKFPGDGGCANPFVVAAAKEKMAEWLDSEGA